MAKIAEENDKFVEENNTINVSFSAVCGQCFASNLLSNCTSIALTNCGVHC